MALHGAFRLVCVSVITAILISCSPAESPHQQKTSPNAKHPTGSPLLVCFDDAGEAAERQDWTAARDACLAGIEFAPNVPALHLLAASFEARLGNNDACRKHLETSIRLGATADLSADDSFSSVLEDPVFEQLADELLENGTHDSVAEIVHRFDDAELWPEGIAVDETTGDLYVGSIHRRAVYRLTPDRRVEEFGTTSQDELMEVLGLWVDSRRRSLWAATGIGDYEEPIDDPPRENELVRFDLDTGRLERRYPVPNDELRLLNDVVVGPDGTAWATETLRGEVFRVSPGGELELFSRYPDLVYLNGLAVSADGRNLILGHYGGLSLVSVADASIRPIIGSDMALGMVDGMSWIDDRLVLVQNSRHVGFRVVRVDLASGNTTVESLEVLPSGLPEGLIPYTCAISGADVAVVAGAPFNLMDQVEIPPRPAVVRMPLDP